MISCTSHREAAVPRPPTGQTPTPRFRAPAALWGGIGWVAGEQGREASTVAREALIRYIAWYLETRRRATRQALHYWADTEGGEHFADPSEPEFAAAIAGLNGEGNTFVTVTPAGGSAAWYARVLVQAGGYELECLTPSLSQQRRGVYPSPEAAAAVLQGWLAGRARGSEPGRPAAGHAPTSARPAGAAGRRSAAGTS